MYNFVSLLYVNIRSVLINNLCHILTILWCYIFPTCITCSLLASQEVNECIQHSEAALEVSRKLYEETGVYLLAGLITDRERLAMEIDRETSSEKLRSIKDQLDGKICSQHFFVSRNSDQSICQLYSQLHRIMW